MLLLAATLVVASALGLLWRWRQGRVRVVAGGRSLLPDLARVGAQPGERATLLQFSSAFCAPCRATRRVLAEVAAVVPGVRHVEVDAEAHLDLVRDLGVLSTPTTLVLDAAGHVTRRAVGQPRPAEVYAALGHALP